MQEVLFAGAAFLCCGDSRVGLTILIETLSNIKELKFSNYSHAALETLLGKATLQISLAKTLRKRVKGKKLALLDGLVLYRNRLATNPRDHIYGILNLVTHDGFKSDYDKSVFALYREVVKYIIDCNQNLDILSGCKGPVSSAHMPALEETFPLYHLFARVSEMAEYMETLDLEETEQNNKTKGSEDKNVKQPSDGANSLPVELENRKEEQPTIKANALSEKHNSRIGEKPAAGANVLTKKHRKEKRSAVDNALVEKHKDSNNKQQSSRAHRPTPRSTKQTLLKEIKNPHYGLRFLRLLRTGLSFFCCARVTHVGEEKAMVNECAAGANASTEDCDKRNEQQPNNTNNENPSQPAVGLRDIHLGLHEDPEPMSRQLKEAENLTQNMYNRYLPSWIPD